MSPDPSANVGLTGSLQHLYETLFLRDLLGYAFPGGVLPFIGHYAHAQAMRLLLHARERTGPVI